MSIDIKLHTEFVYSTQELIDGKVNFENDMPYLQECRRNENFKKILSGTVRANINILLKPKDYTIHLALLHAQTTARQPEAEGILDIAVRMQEYVTKKW